MLTIVGQTDSVCEWLRAPVPATIQAAGGTRGGSPTRAVGRRAGVACSQLGLAAISGTGAAPPVFSQA